MRFYILIKSTIKFLPCTILLTIWHLNSAEANTKIFVEYAAIFDQQCSRKVNLKITPDQIAEAYEKTPDFQKAWDKNGPKFLSEAIRVMGRPYKRQELTLSTSLCVFVPMASPLLVNIRPYLNSTNNTPPFPMEMFTQLSFHEWIHLYLESFFQFQSPLLEKFKNEAFNVQAHLHLMALEQKVYTNLNRGDFVTIANNSYRNVIKGDYGRAWEIVQNEGYESFVKELKESRSKNFEPKE